ncbi:MAG TPA: hypothetical protein VGQ75_00355 [Thermoanaerobaculia bacterium]|jgi:hypothetical protein|nr:hypothetical protein [Thermoanaerobaculia bacterium]
MRQPAFLPALVIGSLLTIAPAPLFAASRQGFELAVLVGGSRAPEYEDRGRTYIEASKGTNFSLHVHNPTCQRIAVALSVDGLNVIDAKRTTAFEATKWLLSPGETIEIPGWQVSGEIARQFFFTETKSSYARWLGKTRNIGTIEAVFFRERRSPPLRLCGDGPRSPRPETAPKSMNEGSSSNAPGGVVGGMVGGVPSGGGAGTPSAPSGQVREQVAVSGEAPLLDTRESRRIAPEKDTRDLAATGIGRQVSFPVVWVDFDEDPNPVASIVLRYEFRRELIRLGVLTRDDELYARESGRGFEPQYAPDPYRTR